MGPHTPQGVGAVSIAGPTTADEFEIRYILDEGHIRTTQRHKSIHRMHCAHALKSRIFVIRKETHGFECWDRLADEFTLYRPLLAAVKAADLAAAKALAVFHRLAELHDLQACGGRWVTSLSLIHI